MTMNKLTIQILIYFDIQIMNAFLALVVFLSLSHTVSCVGMWYLIVSIPDICLLPYFDFPKQLHVACRLFSKKK